MTITNENSKWDNLVKQGKSMAVPTEEQITNALKMVQDPEIGLGLVDLGLIYDMSIKENGAVTVRMTLTTPACPYGEMLVTQAHDAVEAVEGVTEATIDLVWNPPWDPKTMATDLGKDVLGIW